jgi:hypothetical protein
MLSEHSGIQRGEGQGDRRYDNEIIDKLWTEGLVGQGVQLPKDGLPEEVLRVFQCGRKVRIILQMQQLF